MLSYLNDKERPQRLTILLVRDLIRSSDRFPNQVPADLITLDHTHQAYIDAKTDWATLQNDNNMTEMTSRYSRLQRIMRQMEHKYGDVAHVLI